jgi:hypothetical protein
MSGQNRQRFDVRRPDDREVATIEGGELGLTEHLRRGDHGRVDEPGRQIAVSNASSRIHGKLARGSL